MTLTPIRSSYVTLSDDNEAYPSQKYDGINPVKFEISSVEHGIRSSANYPEQLLYVYGLHNMADLGDMSNLYWQEFTISGTANHLTTLLLGYDGLDADGNTWYNNNMNLPTFPALPLLKEANFSNININVGTPYLDLSSSEKLENFRATGSNFTNISFADGVALNTLYLPTSLTSLRLTQANLLTNLLTEIDRPNKSEGKTEVNKGLYIQGLFESATSNISTLELIGGGLGIDSHKLLRQYYAVRNAGSNTSNVTMTDVVWTPYIQLTEGAVYDADKADLYFEDDNHYGLTQYQYDSATFNTRVLNGEIYQLDNTLLTAATAIDDATLAMLNDFRTNSKFKDADSTGIPNITGTVYINNTTAIDESFVRNTLQEAYPSLTFFFANVIKAYSARFMQMNSDGTYTLLGTQKISQEEFANGSVQFTNPILPKAQGGYYEDTEDLIANYDFYGWGTPNLTFADVEALNDTEWYQESKGHLIVTTSDTNVVPATEQYDNWAATTIIEGNFDYDYYAIYGVHKYQMTFLSGDDETALAVVGVPYGETITEPNVLPTKDATGLDDNKVWKFTGWSFTAGGSAITLSNYSATRDYTFYSLYEEASVYDNVTDSKYFDFDRYQVLSVKSDATLSGKITIPAKYGNANVLGIKINGQNVTHIFFEEGSVVQEIVGCQCSTLQFIEPIPSITTIDAQAFRGCALLTTDWRATALTTIGANAFTQAFAFNASGYDIYFPGTLTTVSSQAFTYQPYNNTQVPVRFYFGANGDPTQLSVLAQDAFYQNNNLPVYLYLYYNGTSARLEELTTLTNGLMNRATNGTAVSVSFSPEEPTDQEVKHVSV